jgi:hypothetical protein
VAQHPTPHDDGTKPWPERAPRTLEQIADGAGELRGHVEREAFVAGLIDSGEWELGGQALRNELAKAWGLADRTVREYATRARFAALATPATRRALEARLLASLERAEEHAYGDEYPAAASRAATAAVVEQTRLLGLGSRSPGAGGSEPDDGAPAGGWRPVAHVRCGGCGAGTSADDGPPAFCAKCGKPLEAPAAPETTTGEAT